MSLHSQFSMKELYGTLPSGEKVFRYTLKNTNGMSFSAINYGGIITMISVPDRNGVCKDVVLGYDDLDGYRKDSHYIGAIIGRCANRIAHANFHLNGISYNLYHNDGSNSHHGGQFGFNTKYWDIQETKEPEGKALLLQYTSKDGEEGYPGTLKTRVYYIITEDNSLIIRYRAKCDKTTIVNLTNHTYFNLSGDQNTTIEKHILTIATDKYLPLNENLVPTGEYAEVKNSPLDFRFPKKIENGLDFNNTQIQMAGGIDHSFCIKSCKEPCVTYVDSQSGRVLKIYTTEPGIHIYSGNFLNNIIPGKQKVLYKKRSAIAFETQHFPDSIHHDTFPSTILHPEEELKSETRYVFSYN